MKNTFRLLALMLALCLLLPGMAMAQSAENETAADPALFSIDGKDVYLSEVDAVLYYLVGNGYLPDYDYETAINFLVEEKLIDKQISARGYDKFTQEEIDAFYAEAQGYWDEIVEMYIPYYLSEDTEEGRQLARETVEGLLYAQGGNLDVMVNDLMMTAAYDKLMSSFVGSVTKEEVQLAYEQECAVDKMYFENNLQYYEYVKYYQNYDPLYIPADYRSVIHILLMVDDELLGAYQSAQAIMEEDAAETEEGAEPVDAEAALAAVLESRKEDIDAIYAALEKGETFQNLIAVYGEDPGMKDEYGLREGYMVHPDSIVWDPVFTAAAFSEKMQKPGDVSDPVVGQNGIHILYYLKDIPAGNAELTEERYAEFENSLINQKANAAYNNALMGWRAESDIVFYEEQIAAVINAVNATPVADTAE